MHLYKHTYIRAHASMYISISVSISVSIYLHIHMYIYEYIYSLTHRETNTNTYKHARTHRQWHGGTGQPSTGGSRLMTRGSSGGTRSVFTPAVLHSCRCVCSVFVFVCALFLRLCSGTRHACALPVIIDNPECTLFGSVSLCVYTQRNVCVSMCMHICQ